MNTDKKNDTEENVTLITKRYLSYLKFWSKVGWVASISGCVAIGVTIGLLLF